jgi:hypothetical protein
MAFSTGQRALAMEAYVGSAEIRYSRREIQKKAIAFYLSPLWIYNHCYRMNILENYRKLILHDGIGRHVNPRATIHLHLHHVFRRWLSDKGDH